MKNYLCGILIVFSFCGLSFADCSQTSQNLNSIYSDIQSLQSTWGFSGEYNSSTENYLKQILQNQQLIQTPGAASIQDAQNKLSAYQRYGSLYQQYNSALAQSTSCKAELSSLLDQGHDSFNNKQYQEAINYFKQYLNGNSDTSSESYKYVKNTLIASYQLLAATFENKEDWAKSVELHKEVLLLDSNNYYSNLSLGVAYSFLGSFENAQNYYQKAYEVAITKSDIDLAKKGLDLAKQEVERLAGIKNAPSNDTFAYKQYYLKALNIPAAWDKVKNSKEVVVAVIDDGVNINHPDLVGKIWVSPLAKYGDSKIIDFVGDKLAANLPAGEHGTMIAGIIAASTNNNEGIAGIAKNAKIMPLRVFGLDGKASDDSIIRAMNYAIDNGANIINLSLGGSQFDTYTDKYDNVIKRAYDKGVIVVIAAGNGDVLSKSQTGLDLSVNPISPVCNNQGNTKYSIGVAAMDEKGYKTWWTNYNGCIFAYAPGVGITSTSIPLASGDSYNTGDGTSFAAPIVTGIIALGYNQYGYVSPNIVQECLSESLVKNSVGNYQIDANKYLDALKKRLTTIQQEQIVYNQQSTNYGSADAPVLADAGIIKKQETVAGYNLSSNVLRQEVIGMAMKLGGFSLPDGYSCKKIFKDVSAVKPNNWICRAVEIGVENGIVSGLNKNFNPESNITRAEALAILMKAAGIKVQEGGTSKYTDVTVPWQINIVNTAFSYSFIDAGDSFYPNKMATRGEIFNMAQRILKSKS